MTWVRRLAWLGLIVIAFLLCELTADPGLAAVVACLKFGWDDLLTARWLRLADHDRPRGRACSWFCLITAVCKVYFLAIAMLVLIVLVYLIAVAGTGRQPALDPRQLRGIGIMIAAGMGLQVMLSYVAIASALLHRVKVWVDPRVSLARKGSLWPPYPPGSPPARANLADIVVRWATLYIFAVAAGTTLLALEALPTTATYRRSIGSLLLGAEFALVFKLGKSVERRVVAADPRECWPADIPFLADNSGRTMSPQGASRRP